MKNVLMKTAILFIVAASIVAFSFTLYDPVDSDIQPEPDLTALSGLHEVYIGQTTDACSTGALTVKNSAGQWIAIPNNAPAKTVDVTVDKDGYWFWRCGSENEKSRESLCAKVTRLKITHKNGTITFKCYNHL